MRKLLWVSLSALFILCINSSLACATTGPASAYKVTITKFEMYNGTSWVTILDGASTIMDIASVSAGQAAGNFFSGLTIPDGSYTQMKVTISDTFTISGYVGDGSGTDYTTAATLGGGCVKGLAAAEAECTIDLQTPQADPGADILPSTLTVTGGVASHKIRVNFDVSAGINDWGSAVIYPGVPDIEITMVAL